MAVPNLVLFLAYKSLISSLSCIDGKSGNECWPEFVESLTNLQKLRTSMEGKSFMIRRSKWSACFVALIISTVDLSFNV